MAEQTWQDRYEKMEESQNKLFARLDALLKAFCQTYNISLSSLHGAANSVEDASETDNASDVVISTMLPFESDIRSSTGAAYNQREGGVDDLCGNLATTELKITTGKHEAINASAVTTQAGKRKISMDVVSPRRSGKEIVAIVPNRVSNSVFNCHVFDEMLLRNRVRQTDIPHQFRNLMIRLGVFNTPVKLPPPEPPDCVFVSSPLPVLLTASPVNLYMIKEKGVGYDLTQLQSPGNFLSILQHGRSSIFMNDKQMLLRFGNKISDHRDIADIDEYLLNLCCKIGDVETARQVILEIPKMIGSVYNSHLEKYIAVDKLEAKDILSYDPLILLGLVITCGYEFNCVLDTMSRLPLLKPPDLIYCAMAIPLPPPKPPDRRCCAVVPAAAPKLPIEFSFTSCICGIEEYCIMKRIDKVLMHEYNYIEALIHGLHLLSGYACSNGIIVPAINSVLISITYALILCGRLSCNDVVVWSSLIDGWSTFDHCWMAHVDISLSMLRSALLPQLTFYSQILECIGVNKHQIPELENDQQLKVSLRPFDTNETPSISQANLHVLPTMDILKVCYNNNSKIPFNSNLMTILWKASNYDDNIDAHVFFLTLIMAELFGLFSKEFMEVKSLVSVDLEQMVVEMLDKLETNLILLTDTTVENRLHNRVSSCIGRLAHMGIQPWVLTGDTMEIVLTSGFFACNLLFQGRQLIKNCFNTPETKSFEATGVKVAIGVVHHMLTRLLILGISKSFAIIGTKYIVMGFNPVDCAIFSLRAFFSLGFGRVQQWDPGGQFGMSTTTSTYQFQQWDPGKFIQQQLVTTLRTRLFLMGRVMS